MLNSASLLYFSSKVYFSLRLAKEKKPKRSVLNKCITGISIFVEVFGLLSIWIVIAAYLEEFLLLFIAVSMIVSGALTFKSIPKTLQQQNKQQQQNNHDCLQQQQEQQHKPQPLETNIYIMTSMISSWICPFTVLIDHFTFSQLGKNERTKWRKYFLTINSMAGFGLILIYLSIVAFCMNFWESCFTEENIAPITHCFKINANLSSNVSQSNFTWLKLCSVYENCTRILRNCSDGEASMDMLLMTILPKLIGIIFLCAVTTVVLQILGKLFYIFDNKVVLSCQFSI